MVYAEFDVLILGGGQAAEPLGRALAKAGQRAVVIERHHLGGSCANFGCTPAKAFISSAHAAQRARRAGDLGIEVPEVRVNFRAVMDGAIAIARESVESIEENLAKDGVPVIRGHGRLAGRDEEGILVDVDGKRVRARAVVLDVGTRSLIPRIEGLEECGCVHSDDWLEIEELPKRLTCLGGGYISLELGLAFQRLGSQVTVIETESQVLSQEDEDVARAIQGHLEEEGMRFLLGTEVRHVRNPDHHMELEYEGGKVEADLVLVNTGRWPNTHDLGLETVGIETDEKGNIPVDERLMTSAQGIYAVGDIRGGELFTSTAWDDHRVVLSQLAGNGNWTTFGRITPYGIFVDPPLGRVGMTEREAREAKKRFRVAEYNLDRSGLARERRETKGFIRVLVEEGTDRVLGATVLGGNGPETVHYFAWLMNAGLPYTALRDAVAVHPSFAEAAQNALDQL